MNKRLRIALLILFIPLGVASIGVGWLCYTASGLQFALQQLNHIPGLSARIQGVTGKLAGPLHVAHVTLEHERIHIDIEKLDIDLTPALLLSGLVKIKQLNVAQITATLKPSLTDAPDRAIHFLPTFLRISVDKLEAQQVTFIHTNGYTIVATPLQAGVNLSRNRLRVQQLNAITKEFDARGELSLNASSVLTLLADLDADYKLTNGPVLRGHINASGPVTGAIRTLSLHAQLHEPHVANITGALAFPDSGWSLQGDATADRVLLDAWWQQPAFSFSKLAMQFNLSDAGMHYAGDLTVPEWSPVTLHVDASTHYARRVLTLERVDVSVPQTKINTRTRGSITLGTDTKPLLDLRSSWTGLQWPLHAATKQAIFVSSRGELNLNGSQPYQFDITGRAATPQLPDSAVQASGQIQTNAVQIDDFNWSVLHGVATGSALVGFSTTHNWQFELHGQNLNPAGIHPDWPGQLTIKASGKGRGFDTKAQFNLHVQALTGTLRNQALNAKGRLQHQEQSWLADGIDVRWGGAQLTAQGTVGPQNNLRWLLNAPDLKHLYPDLDGELVMNGEFSGDAAAPQLSLLAKSAHLNYGTWQASGLQLDTQVDVTDKSASRLELNATRIVHGDLGLKQIQLTGTGQTATHQLSLQAIVAATPLPAKMQIGLQLAGTYTDKQWHGMLESLQVIDADMATRVKLLQPTELSLSTHQAELQSACLSIDGGHVCAEGNWLRDEQGLSSWLAHADINGLPLSLSNSALTNDARLQTKVNGQLNISATPTTPWQGTADLQLQTAGIHYKSISGREQVLPIKFAELHMKADALAVATIAELRIGEQTVSTLTATLDRRIGTGLDSWPLSGLLSLSSSDAKLIPVFVSEVDRASGTLAAALHLSGTATTPRFDGAIRLLQGELDFYQLNLALRSIELDAQIKTDQLQFTAQANAGEGVLNGTGNLSWRDAKLFGNLQLRGSNLLIADLPEYRVLASPDLRFDISDKNINITGEVLIPEARLQPKEVIGAVQTSADARFKSEDVFARKQNSWVINSEASIRLGDKINFDGLGLQGRLSGAVATRLRTGERAEGSGELSVNGGSYELYGQKLNITRGRLIYDSTPLGDPGLNIQAERKIGTTTVGVNVRGVLSAPRLQFYSNDSLSQTQIVSYLLIGKPLDELQSGEATTVRSASNTLALEGGGYLASQLGRRVGLDQVGVETDANASTVQSELVLGKFLSPRLFVSYGISLTEAINTVKLRYTLSDHWTLKTEAGEAKGADIEFKIER
ncbi:MAG: translocation/assembly module TamB domain-containing protein [Steroidobacteraceae bacterium]